jgi:hypothetical protein
MTLGEVDVLSNPVGRDGQPTDIGQAVAAALLPLAGGGSHGSTPPPSGVLALAATNKRPAPKVGEKDDNPPLGSATFAELAAESMDLLLKGKTATAALTLLAARRQECAWFDDAIGRFSAAKHDAQQEACDVCTTPSPKWRCAECPRNRLFCSDCWSHVHMAPQALAGAGARARSDLSHHEAPRSDLSGHDQTAYGGDAATKQQTWDMYQAVVGGDGASLDDGDDRARLAEGGVTYDGLSKGGLSVAMGALVAKEGHSEEMFMTVKVKFREVCQEAALRGLKLPPGVVATATFESSGKGAGAGGFRFGEALVSPKAIAEFFLALRAIANEHDDEWKLEPLRIVFAACFGTRVSMYLAGRGTIQMATCDGPHPSSTLLQSVELLTICSWDLQRFVSEYNEHVLAPWKAAQGSWQTGAACQAIKGYVLADVTDR